MKEMYFIRFEIKDFIAITNELIELGILDEEKYLYDGDELSDWASDHNVDYFNLANAYELFGYEEL